MKVPRDDVTPEQWRALEQDAVAVHRTDETVLRLTGPGRVECVQGLVTCDVVKPGDNSHMFGALLNTKGMVVSPLRITRLTDQIIVTLPRVAEVQVGEILTRSLPPRLCRFEDVTDQADAIGWYGARADEHAETGGAALGAGQVAREDAEGLLTLQMRAVARGVPGVEMIMMPGGLRHTPAAAARPVMGHENLLEACRILAGIPALGAEIDEKTLPQEVRYEELGAISYTKGCYLGQETVARLHFRGHANRTLALLLLDREPTVPDEVRAGEKVVGRLTSATWSEDLDAWVGQAVLRREAEEGAEVTLGAGGSAVVRRDRWPREAS